MDLLIQPRVNAVTILAIKTRVSRSNLNSNLCLGKKSSAANISHPADTDFATLAAKVRATESQKDALFQVPKTTKLQRAHNSFSNSNFNLDFKSSFGSWI